MTIIEIAALSNGAHRNQTGAEICPDGWAVIPEELLPVWEESAPFAEITVEAGTVTGITPLDPPKGPEEEPGPDTLEQRVSDLEDAVIELAGIIG